MNYSGVLSILLLLTLSVWESHAQQNPASIHFEKPSYNFGKVKEDGGLLQHDFIFTNRGGFPLLVTDVRASGGVIVTGWTKNPVMPGESGRVSLEYDPEHKPGKFNRRIILSSNGNPPATDLRLLGEVEPRERTPDELFPREIGKLRLKSNHILMGRIPRGQVKTDSMQIINLSGEELAITFSHIPVHISARAVPPLLKRGETGFLIVSYNSNQSDEWGMSTHNFRLMVNGVSPERNIVYVSADIQEDFSHLTGDDRAKAPVITFDGRVFDFGRISQGQTVEHHFNFTNQGQSDLIIRAVRAGCGCTTSEPLKLRLAPGEASSIRAVFNPAGFRGMQNRAITVISNDPASPSLVLRITGEITTD
jgi:hypothetical protein